LERKMMFDNLLADIEEPPSFDCFPLRDTNPVSSRFKRRLVANPNPPMRIIHQRIIEILDRNWFRFDPLGEDDLSPHKNAVKHAASRYFYQTDLQNAYHSVPLDDLSKVIASGCDGRQLEEIRTVFARYCFEKNRKGLIVGGPASPKLFNIYVHATLDVPLRKFWPDFESDSAKHIGKVYTRYSDDLTFSSPDPISDHLRRRIRNIIKAAGFEVNHRKSTVLDIVKGPIIITGVGLAHNPHGRARTFLPRHYLSRMKGLLHLALQGDPRIGRDEVEGLMGVFHAVFGKKHRSARHLFRLNATETKFLELYNQYRRRYGSKRC
jgi:hypothetical protein